MAKLTIPDRYRAGVSAIRHLDKASVLAIRKALDWGGRQKTDLSAVESSPGDMAISAVTSAPTVIAPDLKESIADALTELYGVRSSRDVSVEEFADELSDALESVPEDNLRLIPSERAQFKENLIALLSADLFTIIAKLRDLTNEHERTLCHARIVTDLRPVFGANVEDGPKAMLVVHNLRIAYHKGNERVQDFYVSLSSDDLKRLRQLLDRAEAKAATLTGLTKDVPVLGAKKE